MVLHTHTYKHTHTHLGKLIKTAFPVTNPGIFCFSGSGVGVWKRFKDLELTEEKEKTKRQ